MVRAAARVAPSPPPAGRSVGGGRVRSPSTLSRGRVFVSASTRRSVANAVASPPAADEAEQLSSRLETFDSTRLLIKMIHDAVRTDIPFGKSPPLAVVLASDLALLLAGMFYAGVPITIEGQVVGSFCVLGPRAPEGFGEKDLGAMEAMAEEARDALAGMLRQRRRGEGGRTAQQQQPQQPGQKKKRRKKKKNKKGGGRP